MEMFDPFAKAGSADEVSGRARVAVNVRPSSSDERLLIERDRPACAAADGTPIVKLATSRLLC